MNQIAGSNCKDEADRSNKCCVCGGHNAKNHKKNLNHHATQKRLEIRKLRRLKAEMIEAVGCDETTM